MKIWFVLNCTTPEEEIEWQCCKSNQLNLTFSIFYRNISFLCLVI